MVKKKITYKIIETQNDMKMPFSLLEKMCVFLIIVSCIGMVAISIYDKKTLNKVDTTPKRQYLNK